MSDPREEPRARAAVIGHPIDHSRSPLLHSSAYALLGHDIDYGRIDARAHDAGSLAAMLRHEPGWRGLSVTMPMKQPMIAQMDEVDPLVARLGALNTVLVRRADDGTVRLLGANTDVRGLSRSITAAGLESLATREVLILGAGGTAAAALAAVAELGARRVRLALRDPAKAGELAAQAEHWGLDLSVSSLTSVTPSPAPDLVISTLPPRAGDPLARPLGQAARPGAVLIDVAYDPWPSALASAWTRGGGLSVHGLAMLVHQAIEQIVLFTGDVAAREPRVVRALCDAADITERGEAKGSVAG